MPGAILTLTEREVEVLGFALMRTMQHHRMNWEAASPGWYKDDYRAKMNETRDLIAKLDAAPAGTITEVRDRAGRPAFTWSDHDRNVPADEQDEDDGSGPYMVIAFGEGNDEDYVETGLSEQAARDTKVTLEARGYTRVTIGKGGAL